MISYYPSSFWNFFQLQRSGKYSSTVYFFQSWEDALWHLLDCGVIRRGKILVPNFYCLDVVNNMRTHGLEPLFYRLDRSLHPDISQVRKLLRQHRPSAMIICDVAGMTSALHTENAWRRDVPKQTYVIHDYVHRLYHPHHYQLPSPRDIILDSLRKVSPLSGSRLTVHPDITDQVPRPTINHPLYTAQSRIDFVRFRALLWWGTIRNQPSVIRHAHRQTLQKHDDLIGDSVHGNAGPLMSKILSHHLAVQKIERIKETQAAYYYNKLSSYDDIILPAPIEEFGHLHAFPLVVSLQKTTKLEPLLDKLNVWTKFPDSPWSRLQRVFFLPMGPHITIKDQELITATIQKAL